MCRPVCELARRGLAGWPQPLPAGPVTHDVTVPPGWYRDPFAPGQLRWWGGVWTSYTAARKARAAATGALILGIVAFVPHSQFGRVDKWPFGQWIQTKSTADAEQELRRAIEAFLSSDEAQRRQRKMAPDR